MIEVPDLSIGDDDYAVTVATTLDGVVVRIALRWLARIGRWAAYLTDAAGAPASAQLLVQPGGEVLFDRRSASAPPGRLVWVGPDDYGRLDLGARLRLWYVPA